MLDLHARFAVHLHEDGQKSRLRKMVCYTPIIFLNVNLKDYIALIEEVGNFIAYDLIGMKLIKIA